MRLGKSITIGAALAATGLLLPAIGATAGRGEEPGRFGRFFRFGNAPASAPAPAPALETRPGATFRESTPSSFPAPPATSTAGVPGAQPRLVPQPRVSRPVTDADPLVTRISLGRSDDGNQFGMFLQVYADGTVIDSEGVHQVGREALKELVGALEQGDYSRLKGHCGGPSTDFVEHVQMVVYERTLGRLRATAFSFSGNTQGCDHAVRHLQTTLDALQMRLTRSVSGPASVSTGFPSGGPSTPTPAPPIQLNDGLGALPQ